jgi:hypothetical protein
MIRFGLVLLFTVSLQTTRAQPLLDDQQPATANPSGHFANLQGQVRDKITGRPITSATISLPAFNLIGTSDERGNFTWQNIQIPSGAVPTNIWITAPGYGDWQIEAVRLVAGDTLLLTAELGERPTRIEVPPPKSERTDWPTIDQLGPPGIETFRDQTDLQLPENIRVRIAGSPYHCNPYRDYTIETVNFFDYVRHVLPNEWNVVESGDDQGYWESMRAGAIAVKNYAWYWIARGGKWDDADVWDSTCDQVYNPAVAYASSDAAVAYTWNWRLTRDNLLVETNYRAYHSQCPNPDSCMGQIDADQMAATGATWDEIIFHFYLDTALSTIVRPSPGEFALRFFGNGYGLYDRVLVPLNGPNSPIDVGAEDFSIELWIKATAVENAASPVVCGPNHNWILGNVFLDREGLGQERNYGLSLAGGRVVFGVTGEDMGSGAEHITICGVSNVADDSWHHIAVQRRRADGYLWLYVDGHVEASADGPDGDISFSDQTTTMAPNLVSDLIIGAGRRDAQAPIFPPFTGLIDELHFSQGLLYNAEFAPAEGPLTPGENSLAYYNFNDGYGNILRDTSGAPGGPSHGTRSYGGEINGPDWVPSDLFLNKRIFIPIVIS